MTTTSELNSQIETKRGEISELAHRIGDRVEEYIDWRGMVQERPLETVGIAFGTGLLLSGAARPIMRFVLGQTMLIARGSAVAFLLSYLQGKSGGQGVGA